MEFGEPVMPRTKLDLPRHFDFRTELSVRITDVNYAGHLGNDSVLSLIHEARTLMLKSKGFSEGDVGGVGIIMVDAVVVYMSEAFHGDVLVVEVGIENIDASGCDFFYRLTDKASGREVVRAKTGIAFFDFGRRKVSRTPERFRALFLRG